MATNLDKEIVMVSACLTGMKCVNYPSLSLEDPDVTKLFEAGRALPFCPEQIGGLPTPRPPAGFLGGGSANELWTESGSSVVRMVSAEGDDFTEEFLRGATEILRMMQLVGAKEAILCDGSPSCGVTKTSVYNQDGFLVIKPGCGVLTWLLQTNQIKVYTPHTWKERFQGTRG